MSLRSMALRRMRRGRERDAWRALGRASEDGAAGRRQFLRLSCPEAAGHYKVMSAERTCTHECGWNDITRHVMMMNDSVNGLVMIRFGMDFYFGADISNADS